MNHMQTTVTAAARRSFVTALAGLLVLGAAVLSPGGARAQGNLPEFADLAERVGPAVVNIRTTEKRSSRKCRKRCGRASSRPSR